MSFKKLRERFNAKASEASYENLPEYSVKDLVNGDGKDSRIVYIGGIPMGIATSDEDEKAMKKFLHRFGKDLDDKENAAAAYMKMLHHMQIAKDFKEADLVPESEVTIDGTTYYQIDGKLYTEDGEEAGECKE